MSGFDHDDYIQRVVAMVVMLVTVLQVIILQPDDPITIVILWTVGCLATLWYFSVAKGTLYPRLWVDDIRTVARDLFRRTR